MKKKLLFVIVLFCYAISFAQSTNMDRKRFGVSYIKLPSSPILDDSKRTFSTNSKFISLYGFSKVNSGASLDIILDYQGIAVDDYDIVKNKVEDRDSDGKLIRTRYEYQVIVDYNSRAAIQISNSLTGESNQEHYLENSIFKSGIYKSYDGAKKYYAGNATAIKKRYRSEQWVRLIRRIKSDLNEIYGYVPFEIKNETFLILSSKKHPEYVTHQKLFDEAESIFDRMKYNEPIDGLALRLKPLIDSFEKITTKYTGTKRKERKIRHASYFNISKMYYYMDNPEEAKKYAQKIIDNDFNLSEGRRLISLADRLKERLDVNQLANRHFDIVTEDLTNLDYSDVPEEDNFQELKQQKEVDIPIIAYLITTANDTLTAQISNTNISKIGYTVDVHLKGDDNNLQPNTFKAEEINTLALANGEIYKTITFDEVSTGTNVPGPKLVKTLHESDQITLYVFNDKELILKTPNSDKGTSTLTPDFVFGIHKKLALYAADCPKLKTRAQNNEFKNNQESLLEFCKALSNCD
ncbi:hypothetical protein [Aquimarina sp. AU474]|uniref:hypothetical protein n=1 Tax=Aquimarina sp. AU474 TaxID=2108529 RepID=UPI000D69051E|nr:hypothetical protein [Aquimarina sp. AU474]